MHSSSKIAMCSCVILAFTACDQKSGPALEAAPPDTKTAAVSEPAVLVFAAASMKAELDDLSAKFEALNGAKMVISYASSSVLAQQIQNGAPADLFISADPALADHLEESGHAETRVDFLGNSLVLIVPASASDNVKRPEDLAGDAVKHIAIGDPASVPAGRYAQEALETLGLWARLGPKCVPGMDVRQALLYVENGAADAGIVYASDAKSSKAVRVVAPLDAYLKSPIRYSLVLVKRDGRSATAQEGFLFLQSKPVLKLFEAAGFTRLSGPSSSAAPQD